MSVKNELIKKRTEFVRGYISANPEKKIEASVIELSDRLFLSERTIWRDLTRKELKK